MIDVINYNIIDNFKINLNIERNKYNINPQKLFLMAARKNKKRSFLFVSKVLGKHIPVNPKISLLTGKLLGYEYVEKVYGEDISSGKDIILAINDENYVDEIYENEINNLINLKEKTLFIGFAETATALGHSVFSSFKENVHYIHTTRDEILDSEVKINFEEEHSHATSHRLYPIEFDIINSDAPIVFIDDEITTGKTTLNIIEAIHKKYPRKNYTIISILDWRNENDKMLFKEVENKLGIKINTISLLSGGIEVINENLIDLNTEKSDRNFKTDDVKIKHISLDQVFEESVQQESIDSLNIINKTPYLKFTGRFGIDSEQNMILNKEIIQAAKLLNNYRNGKRTLCMGTGEFMYIPMLLSSYLGDGIYYQSTTRSPIHPNNKEDYGAKNVYKFDSQDDNSIMNYFYNIPENFYDDMFLFLEREVSKEKSESLIDTIKTMGIKDIKIVTFKKDE